MKKGISLIVLLLISHLFVHAQVDLTGYNKKGGATVSVQGNLLGITWPTGGTESGKILFNLEEEKPLFGSIQLNDDKEEFIEIASSLDPAFLLTIGKRDLTKGSGWNIFFDITGYLPYEIHKVKLQKSNALVKSEGSRTKVIFPGATAGEFSGIVEITLYNGSPLMNIAAVMSTQRDSVAIIYDAGLVSDKEVWKEIFWSDPENNLQSIKANTEGSKEVAVKYRTIIGENNNGRIAVFPPPHQYFYPMDNAYNLKYTWYGNNYRDKIQGFGIGIRQEPLGDLRFTPWFNAPPNTQQRLNFFCLLSKDKDGSLLKEVKAFTHEDSYKPLSGYKTMASHFHTEHTDDIITHKPLPEVPNHVTALNNLGVNIMHLGEFHLFRGGHPYVHQPVKRLLEYDLMFKECERLSSGNFLMLPGEEPNRFFGGHWMNLFPKPVYWIMSRQPHEPFVDEDPKYGKVYRISNKDEMLRLLEIENGLAWTAHARIKGSTGFPDKYKEEEFFHSERFLGASWKAVPADLSQPRLGKRVLDLMDEMANWGHRKYAIGEADLFRLEPTYELYGHMNINYLLMDKLPEFEDGWQPVLDAMENGKFFVTTGEVLLPSFKVNDKGSGETVQLDSRGKANISVNIDWTFPLNFAEIISGDGVQVFRERIDLRETKAFGKQEFNFSTTLKDRKWVRLEVWDVAANGAFTQFVWME